MIHFSHKIENIKDKCITSYWHIGLFWKLKLPVAVTEHSFTNIMFLNKCYLFQLHNDCVCRIWSHISSRDMERYIAWYVWVTYTGLYVTFLGESNSAWQCIQCLVTHASIFTLSSSIWIYTRSCILHYLTHI